MNTLRILSIEDLQKRALKSLPSFAKAFDDIGALWENFVVLERIKRDRYLRSFHHSYFWRTYEQHEVDYVEEKDGQINAYEIKWNEKSKGRKGITAFTRLYKNASADFVNKENYLDFIVK